MIREKFFCLTRRCRLVTCNNELTFVSALQKENKSVWTSVPQTASTSCVGKDPVVSCLETAWKIKSIFLTMFFLLGLVSNLINWKCCRDVTTVRGSTSNPRRKSLSLIASYRVCFPINAPLLLTLKLPVCLTHLTKKNCLQHWWWWLVIHVQITADFAFLTAVVHLVFGAVQKVQCKAVLRKEKHLVW